MNNQADKYHKDNNCIGTNIGIATNDGNTMNGLMTSGLNSSKSICDDDTRKEIGITIASDKHLNTIDSFWFALRPGTFVRPFDFVTIEFLNQDTKTIGMIQDIQTIASDHDRISPLGKTGKPKEFTNHVTNKGSVDMATTSDYDFQHGINVAKVVVIANSEYKEEGLAKSHVYYRNASWSRKSSQILDCRRGHLCFGSAGNDFSDPCWNNRNE